MLPVAPPAPLLRTADIDASIPGGLSDTLPLARVSGGGHRSAFGPRTCRFQVAGAPGSVALTTVGVTLEATLDGKAWTAIGDELVGAGISELLDIRGYLAVRAAVTTTQTGAKIDIALYATDADPDAPEAAP